MKLIILFLGIICLLNSSDAFAFYMEEGSGEKTMTIEDYIEDFVDVPENGTNWKLLGTTKEITIETKTDDGFDLIYAKPEFQKEVKALDGKEIILKGFMFPLDGTPDQKLFLFGPFPLSCPFRYHVGPALVVEVHADKNPVTFDYDPVTLKGTLELVPDDPEYSVFYRLKNVKQIK